MPNKVSGFTSEGLTQLNASLDALDAKVLEIDALRGTINAKDAEIVTLRERAVEVDNDRLGLRDVEVTTPSTTGEEFVVTHNWGRQVNKVVLVSSQNGTVLRQGPTANTQNKIFLRASQASDNIVIRPAE